MAEPICDECGFSVESAEHRGGIGQHGHVSFSAKETAKQREAERVAAEAFAAEQHDAYVTALREALAEATGGVTTPSTPAKGKKEGN